MSDEPLYVDPERLAAHARPYESASHDWARLKSRVTDIRARYAGVWGDDDLGRQFGPSFTEGLDSVEGRVNVVSTTLGYYSEGLVENGKIYGEAREDADQSTYLLLVDSEMVGGYEAPADPNAPARRYMTPEGEGTERPLLRRAMTIQGRILTPAEEGEVTPLRPMLASRRLAVEGETYQPDEEGQATPRLLARGKLLTPDDELTPLKPALLMRREAVADPGTAPLEPLLPARREAVVEPETPLEPTRSHVFYRSVHPATPAIPAVPAEEPE
ncbi:hypothetical protein [Actinoplanes sp. L3-i22]|uniref:hypothetical protein n=1 Tax=Actinoplanes sp. L3-i22 TaxID=2836373 RepID=UPI001C77E3F7|nr:hypothetical protein [Actinoplanes sp. L3-i22]BCY13397.1 hypothetical protein L3i22_084850 [Actinoplanes sp. L3-i22]